MAIRTGGDPAIGTSAQVASVPRSIHLKGHFRLVQLRGT